MFDNGILPLFSIHMVNGNYRIDLELVNSSDQKEITKVQQKLNQWITTNVLVKYKTTPLGNGLILFEICRLKEG